MRKFIIGLSLLFYALSGTIIFRALEIPARNTSYQNDQEGLKPKNLPPKVEDMQGQFAKEQAANRALIKEMKATIANLEDKLSEKTKEIQVTVKNEGAHKKTRVLAVLGGGAFSSGQVGIDVNLMNAVKELGPAIQASPDYRVIIEGHTDNKPIKSSAGTQYTDNMELSFLRAKTVALILEKYGISLDRISVIGYGDTRPVASNDSEEGRAKNRRVEVKIIPGDKEF